MSATRSAREALANLSPQTLEQHRVMVLLVDLLCEQNEILAALAGRLAGDQGDSTSTAPARTPEGAGRPAAGDQPAAVDEQDGEQSVRLTEPELPPDDVDPPPAAAPPAARPRPARKATPAAKAKTGTKTSGGGQ